VGNGSPHGLAFPYPLWWELLFGEALGRDTALPYFKGQAISVGENGYLLAEMVILLRSSRASSAGTGARLRGGLVKEHLVVSNKMAEVVHSDQNRHLFDSKKRVLEKLACPVEPSTQEVAVRRNAEFCFEEMTEPGF